MADDFDPFRPLSDDERAATAQEPGRDGEPDAAKPTLPPADAEPAEAAAARLFCRPADAMWRYPNAEGETVFFVCRWDEADGDKEIRPLSWFEGDGWRFAHWPAPRPLYNLDKLAARPDAPVIICEGEKAADAAARIFPEYVATTSSGGAKATAQTDWTPLEGRRVLNLAGRRQRRRGIRAPGRVDRRGSPMRGYRRRRHGARPHQSKRRRVRSGKGLGRRRRDRRMERPGRAAHGRHRPRQAVRSGTGLFVLRPLRDGRRRPHNRNHARTGEEQGNSLATDLRSVRGAGRMPRPARASWGKVLRWRDGDGREHLRHVADRALHGDLPALCGSLADHGLRIDPARQAHLRGYLAAVRVKRRATIVERTGWHEISGRNVFVLPDETIGLRGGERVILDAARGPYEARGILEDWRGGAAKLASGHVVLVLEISAALAGPLLGLAGYEGGGVHIRGLSSTGKTTALRLAASVWGRGDTPGFVRTWRATANGLEGAAAGATDSALILDELGQVEAREFAAAAYMLANGAGKSRAHRDGALRDPRAWRLMFLSSGEVSLEAKLIEERGRNPRAGQLVRMLDTPAKRAFGVFDNAGPKGDAAALAKACSLAAVSAYGTAGPEFVRRLIAEGVQGDDVRTLVNDFIAANVPPGAEGQIDRAAQRFGLIAAAGELATEFGVTGWKPGEAREAATWAFAAWIEGRGGVEPAEVQQAIEAVRHFIETHGEARFHNLDGDEARPVSNRAGWRRGTGDEQRWLILPEVWKAEVCPGLDPTSVARVLSDPARGMLIKGSDCYSKVEKIAGTTKRVYVITPRIFDGG